MAAASLALDINKQNPHLENSNELKKKTSPEKRDKRQISLHRIESQDLRLYFLTATLFSLLKTS